MPTSPSSFHLLLQRSLALLVLTLATLFSAPAHAATTADDIDPANLPGSTYTVRYSGNRTFETNLSLQNNIFFLQFTSATTYVRSGSGSPGIVTEGGTYTVTSSTLAGTIRTTVITFNNNFTAPGSTTPVVITFVSSPGDPFASNFTLTSGTATAGGTFNVERANLTPAITSRNTAVATVGQPFTYQIAATNSPTSYNVITHPSTPIPGLTFSATTGLVSATFTAAGQYTFNAFAINSAGSAFIQVLVTVTGTTATAPVITSATTVTATVGTPFTYQITATPAATSYTNAGGNAPVQINPTTGLASGTFTSAGTFTFSFTASNAAGSSPVTTVTVTVTGGTTGTVARYAGRYTGFIGRRAGTTTDANYQAYSVTISSTGAVSATFANFNNALTGTIATNGVITFTGGSQLANYGIVTALVEGTTFLSSYGTAINNAQYRFENSTSFLPDTTGGGTVTLATAPTNLVGYRNKVGGVYQFTVTGVARGAVWGTDVYTDDSTIATAAVHAGVLAAGETKTVTVTILTGRPSYPASTRNGVSSAAWGSWAGSYSFAGAGAVAASTTAGNVATAIPTLAPGWIATTTALAAGGRFVCPIAVSGGGTYTYQWYLNNVLIAGATVNPYVVESLTAAQAGTYTVNVTNSLNPGATNRLTAGTVTVGAAGSPVLALQPISKTVVPGATFTLAANASGTANTYQWFRNNVALSGETGAILLRNNANTADSGAYTVRISNSSGTVTSSAATVTLSANASRPANISVRTNVATGTLVTPGFVVQGTGTKRVLIRAVGPGLAAFGLAGTMADPKFTVFQGSTKIAETDDWTTANIGQAFTATGAFALPAGSKDAALVTDLAAGKDYTVQVTNASGAGGIVLVEVYDADALRGTSTSKLVNVSVRGQTAPGDDVLTLGLVIGGTGPRTLLVRGVGPKLASFGVQGTVPDPRLQIVDSQGRIILANDDWAAADFVSELALATTYVGAFALDAGGKDAATLSLVDPGAYTIQVSGTTASPTGEALVEVYEVP